MNAGKIIGNTSHRPWKMPEGKWSYYQEWNHALFLHWKFSLSELKPHIPADLEIDSLDGNCWISIVAFTMEKIRPRSLPAVSIISDFHEINVRTYVVNDNKQGVYFLSIEAEKILSSLLARKLSGLPYNKSEIRRQSDNNTNSYSVKQRDSNFQFDARFKIGKKIISKSALDTWLTERYCLYLDQKGKNYMYEIHHQPWNLYEVEVSGLEVNYQFGSIALNRKPDLMHYSDGVKVVAWKKKKCPGGASMNQAQ